MSQKLLLWLTLVAALVGVFFRFWDLGGAPLAVDEYYFGRSVLNIVERGLPEFSCGGIYPRGILLQYMTLPLLKLGLSLELAIRFWPAVASVLSIIAVWRITLLTGERLTTFIAVLLLSLSVWEVEFARFGRMYSPFQAIVLWYVYFQIRHLVYGQTSASWVYLPLSLISVLVYEGGIFLLALNFLPLIWPERRWTVSYLLTGTGLLLAGLYYYVADKTELFSPSAKPTISLASTEPIGPSQISLPIDLPPLPDHLLPLLAMGLVFLIILFCRHRTQFNLQLPSALVWILAVVCFSFGLIALGTAAVVIALLLRLPSPLLPGSASTRGIVIAAVVLGSLWFVALVWSFSASGTTMTASVKDALKYLLNYPDLYYKLVYPWLRTIPFTSILVAGLVLFSLRSVRVWPATVDRAQWVVRYLLAISLVLILLASVVWQPYRLTRYTYFIYPLLIILASVGLVKAASVVTQRKSVKMATMAALMFIIFLFAEDFRLGHLAHINEAAYRYRTAYDQELNVHYYPRIDYRSAADYVNRRLGDEDSVIAFDMPLPHYLGRTSAIYVERGTSVHYNVASCGGSTDRWSNLDLLDSPKSVSDYLESTQDPVWLILRTDRDPIRRPFEKELMKKYAAGYEFSTVDGKIAVYRIE